ncbi:uncharacterized protein LOC117783988 [Drosophila innubila]|uniref:uncharacterized protein LOC117783988 n=1 Tax=Drosophila innubila TaxID=198719 RepID=UPI00148D1824|nr:uncharacterized protein LOC117783988 [Drosophila innubila]
MNGARKFKSLRLVRFGDILFDQQKRLIMLCRSCQRHYMCLESFQTHLSKCIGIKHIVSSIDELQYDEDKRETRLINGKQELFIYEPDAVRSDNKCDIDWEAELEDPRWYTDDAKTLPSKAKQLPANAKENVARSRTRFQARNEAVKEDKQQQMHESPQLPVKRMRHSTPKRTILTNQQQSKSRSSLDLPTASAKTRPNEVYVVKNVVEDLKHLDAMSTVRAAATTATPSALPMVSIPSTTTTKSSTIPMVSIPLTTTTKSSALPMASIPSTNLSNGDTQQILNKLRACGVEVKRRNTRETVEIAADAAAIAKKQQALDIMRKLQSNGIKCTKVNKPG